MPTKRASTSSSSNRKTLDVVPVSTANDKSELQPQAQQPQQHIPLPLKPAPPTSKTCTACSKTFADLNAAAAHCFGKHGMVCPSCDKAFALEQHYRNHYVDAHLKEKPESEKPENKRKWLPTWKYFKEKNFTRKQQKAEKAELRKRQRGEGEGNEGGNNDDQELPKQKKRRKSSSTAPAKLEGFTGTYAYL